MISFFQGRQEEIGAKGQTGNVGPPGHEVTTFLIMRVFTKIHGCILPHVHNMQQYITVIIIIVCVYVITFRA